MRTFGLCFAFVLLSYTLAAPFDRRQQQSYIPSDTDDGPPPYQSSWTADPSLDRPSTDPTSRGPLPYVPSDSRVHPHANSQNYPNGVSIPSTENGDAPPSAQPGNSFNGPPTDYNLAQSPATYRSSQGPSASGYSPQAQSSTGYSSDGGAPRYGPEEIPPPTQATQTGHTGQSPLQNGNQSPTRSNSGPSSDRFLPDFGTLTKDIPKEATLPKPLTAPPSSDFRLNGTQTKGGPHGASGESPNKAGPNMTALADPTHPPYVPSDASEFANKSYVPSIPDAPRNLSNMPASVKQPSKDMQAESTSSHSLEGMPPAVLPTANGTQDHRSNMSMTLPDQSKPVFADLPKRQFSESPKRPGNALGGGIGSNLLPDAGVLSPGVLPGAGMLGGAGQGGPNPHGGRGSQSYGNGDVATSPRQNHPSAANGPSGPGPMSGGHSYGGGPSAQSIPPGGDVVHSGPASGPQYAGGPVTQSDGYDPQSGVPAGGMPMGNSAVTPDGTADGFSMPVSAQSDPYHHEQGSAPGTMQQSESYMPPTTSNTDHGYRTAGDSSMHERNAGGPVYNKPYTGDTNRW